jgi:membrane protein DedA with SNARE-associated domain
LTLASLVADHGYWIVAAGCLLEGETVLLLAGFAAKRGYLDPVEAVGVASAAAFAGDQVLFWLGRRYGHALLARWPAIATRAARVSGLIDRHPQKAALIARFIYGTRLAAPILIGMSSMPQARFAPLNAIAAIAWAILFTAAGWFLGTAAEVYAGDLGRIEGWLLAIAIAAVVAWRLTALLKRRAAR